MELSESDLNLVIPLVFFAIAIPLGWLALSFARRSAAADREKARNLALALGLEYGEGRDPVEDIVPEGSPGHEKATEFFRKFPLFGFLSALAPWRVSGERGGVRVEIFPETRSSGKSSTTYTVARAWLREPAGQELRIAREGFFTKVGKTLFGLQDVEVGDAVFDQAVRIKAKDPLQAKLLLDRLEVRERVLALLEAQPGAFVTSTYAHWEKQGTKLDEAELGGVLDLLVPVARALGGDS